MYIRVHGALAQLLYLMTGEKLPWRSVDFGSDSSSSPIMDPLKGVPLLPLCGTADIDESGTGSSGGNTAATEDRQALLLWQYTQPLLKAYLFGRGEDIDLQRMDAAEVEEAQEQPLVEALEPLKV